jgi:hypothetical protein
MRRANAVRSPELLWSGPQYRRNKTVLFETAIQKPRVNF